MFRPLKRDKRGFTIVEAIMSAAITGVIFTVMYGVYVTNFDMWDVGNEVADLQANCRRSLNVMVTELRKATKKEAGTPPNVYIPPSPNNTYLHYYLPYMTNSTTVSVVNDDISWDTTTVCQFQYVSANNTIAKHVGANITTIAYNVANLRFTNSGFANSTLMPDEIKIDLTMQKTSTRNKTFTIVESAIVKLRN